MNFIRESIFASSLRAFASAFLGIIGGLLGLLLFFAISGILFSPNHDGPANRYQFVNQPRLDGTLNRSINVPTIIRVNVDSMIGGPSVNADNFDNLFLQIDQQMSKENVKGILVYLDTPGGSAIDSYRMYLKLKEVKARYNIPVFGFVEGMCASGGVYISAACDKMFSSPPSILGSVGVRMGPFFNVSDLLKTHGVAALNISTKNKIHLDPFTPWKPDEENFFKPAMDDMYAQFVEAVVDGRCPEGMTKEQYKAKLLDVGAAIFTSKDAVAYGFTNEPHATLNSTLEALLTAANINKEQDYRFVSAVYIPPFQFGGVQSVLRTGKLSVEHHLGKEQEMIKNDQFLAIYP